MSLISGINMDKCCVKKAKPMPEEYHTVVGIKVKEKKKCNTFIKKIKTHG